MATPRIDESKADGGQMMIWTTAGGSAVSAAETWTIGTNVAIAVLTLGALVATIKIARDEARRGAEDRRERLFSDERAQASRVVSWEEQEEERETVDDEGHTALIGLDRTIYLANYSDAPVHEVTVFVEQGDPPWEHKWDLAVLAPTSEPLTHRMFPNLSEGYGYVRVSRMILRDSAGRGWERQRDGALIRRHDLDLQS